MGSQPLGCAGPGKAGLLVHLAAGTYDLSRISLGPRVSLEGSGEEKTVIEGTVRPVRKANEVFYEAEKTS